MTEQRINPMTVACPYCQVNALRPCVLRGSRDEHNGFRGRVLTGYHDSRVEAAREAQMVGARG